MSRKSIAEIKISTLSNVIHPCPTQAETIRKVAESYNRRIFTPMIKRIFRRWMTWQRS
jgi:hypothetical protein